MRNHSHCRRKRAARGGGLFMPHPGHSPLGAKKRARKPASRSIPSDWYSEKSPAAHTKERKQTRQIKKERRGQRLKKARTEQTSPIQLMASSMCELDESQNRVGAYQKR